jgi:hypothetical protein
MHTFDHALRVIRILGLAIGAGMLTAGLWCAPLVDEVAELVAAVDAELGIGAIQV